MQPRPSSQSSGVPLWQPTLNSGMTEELKGYEFWFHRQLDARKFSKASA